MKMLIIQSSPPRTASTLLANALYGFIPSINDKKIIFSSFKDNSWEKDIDGNIIVIKSHNTNIDKLIKHYNDRYKLFFICSERGKLAHRIIDEKYKLYDNVIVFKYEELNETSINPLTKIVDNIYNKISFVLNIDLNKALCIDRLNKMNEVCLHLKDKPFSYYDEFYHIHGNHRNRKYRRKTIFRKYPRLRYLLRKSGLL